MDELRPDQLKPLHPPFEDYAAGVREHRHDWKCIAAGTFRYLSCPKLGVIAAAAVAFCAKYTTNAYQMVVLLGALALIGAVAVASLIVEYRHAQNRQENRDEPAEPGTEPEGPRKPRKT